MVRIAVRTITLNCLKGMFGLRSSFVFEYIYYWWLLWIAILLYLVNDKNIITYMAQPSSLKYFKKLVYYVISLAVTMNKMVESM